MTRYKSTLQVRCKCGEENCKLPPTQGYSGFAYSHASEELKEKVKAEKGTKHRQSIRKRQNKANLAKKLWLAQKEVGVPKKALKRQSKSISKFSKKMLENLKIYNILRKDYLKDHPICECGRNGCKRKSQDIHHKKGRGVYLNVVEYWLAVARVCHTWITENPKEAMVLGLTGSRLN